MKKGLIKNGTLVIAALCRDGVVFCADKGGILDNVGPLKNQDKLFDLGSNAHFAACGSIKVVNPRNYSEEWFNAITITRNYFARTQFTNNDAFWEELKNEIAAEFGAYLDDSDDKQEINFQLIFFCLDHENKIRHKRLTFKYDGQSEAIIDISQMWFKGLYGAFGSCQIAYGLLKEEKRLATLAKHPSIKPFINRTNTPSDVSLNQALAFIKKIMDASSQLIPCRGHVSPEFDYVVLKGAFQFIQLNEQN